MLGKSQTLNLFFFKFSTMCFHLIKVAECQPFYIYFLGFPLSILFMMPCFQKHSLANSDLYSSKCSPRRCCSLSSLPAKIILSNITVKRSTFLTDHAFEGSIFKPETWRRLSPLGSLTTTFLADCEKKNRLSILDLTVFEFTTPKKARNLVSKSCMAHFFHTICFRIHPSIVMK